MSQFVSGYWFVLNGTGGELDRFFIVDVEAGDELQSQIISAQVAERLKPGGGWSLAAGDTITVEEGESEL